MRAAARPGIRHNVPGGYLGQVLLDGPVAYYRMGEASGSTMFDSSGNSRNGLYVNSPTLGAGRLQTSDSDTAASFASGSSQEATSTSLPALTVPNFMVEFLFKTSDLKVLLRDATSAGGSGNFVTLGTTNVSMRISGTTYTSAVAASGYANNARHHCAFGADASKVYLYLDGAPAISVTRTASGNVVLPWHIARNGTNTGTTNYVTGVFDEVAIYNGVLSAARVAAHYAAL